MSGIDQQAVLCSENDPQGQVRATVYRGPVLRHSAELIQAANFRSAVAF